MGENPTPFRLVNCEDVRTAERIGASKLVALVGRDPLAGSTLGRGDLLGCHLGGDLPAQPDRLLVAAYRGAESPTRGAGTLGAFRRKILVQAAG